MYAHGRAVTIEAMESSRVIAVGTPVLVRNQFDGAWAPHFHIAAVESEGCWLRRNRDGALLPKVFAWGDVRATSDVVADPTDHNG
jgi:hypothetical protein